MTEEWTEKKEEVYKKGREKKKQVGGLGIKKKKSLKHEKEN